MTEDLKHLNQLIRNIESKETLTEDAQQVNEFGSVAGKLIPGVGLGLGAYDAYKRAKAGDITGAALSGLGGVASLIPGLGTAASLGLAGVQAGRDKTRTGSWFPSSDEIKAASADKGKSKLAAAPQPKALELPGTKQGPEVAELQKQLIARGAKIEVDGIMGPQTMAAFQQFGTTPSTQMASIENKGIPMTESERIANLNNKLKQIDEGPMDIIKGVGQLGAGALQGAKNIVKGAQWGASHPGLTSTLKATPGMANKLGTAAAKTTGAMARNPMKTAAIAAAGGAGLAGGNAAAAPELPAKLAKNLTSAEQAELAQLVQELQDSTDPEVLDLLKKYQQVTNPSLMRSIGRGIHSIGSGVASGLGDLASGVFTGESTDKK